MIHSPPDYRVALFPARQYKAHQGFYCTLKNGDTVYIIPFRSYRDFKAWYKEAQDGTRIFHQIWFNSVYSYCQMKECASELENLFHELQDANYYRVVERSDEIDLCNPVHLKYEQLPYPNQYRMHIWTDDIPMINSFACHSLL